MSTPPQQHHQTAEEDRVPWKEKLGLGLGIFGNVGAMQTALQLVQQIFVQTMRMDPVRIGLIQSAQNIGNLAFGPFLGQFADNFRSPWGRRHPLLVLSAIPMVAAMAAMYFFPVGISENALSLWLLIACSICTLVGSLNSLIVNALSVEATGDYHERVRVGRVNMLFSLGVAFGIQWIVPLTKLPVFGGTINGLHIVVGVLAVVFLATVLAPLFLCPEKRYGTLSKKKPSGSFIVNLKEASKNKPFLVVLGISVCVSFCINVVGSFVGHMNTYYIFGGQVDKAQIFFGPLGSAYCLAAAAATTFVYPFIARRWSKQASLRFAAVVLIVDSLSKIVIYNPKYPWLQIFVLMANGIAAQGIIYNIGTMMGDVVDYDELLTGKRREALYQSLLGWGSGLGGAIAPTLCGLLLRFIGFDPKLLGPQSHSTLELMKYSYVVFPMIGAMIALILIARYDLSEERCYEIRDELKRRHAAEAEFEAQNASAEVHA